VRSAGPWRAGVERAARRSVSVGGAARLFERSSLLRKGGFIEAFKLAERDLGWLAAWVGGWNSGLGTLAVAWFSTDSKGVRGRRWFLIRSCDV